MSKHTLPSGAVLEVTILPFEDAWQVSQDLLVLAGSLDIDVKGMNLDDIKAADVLDFKTPLCKVLSSQSAMSAAWKCFARCTYNGLRVDKQTFEKPEARGDFLIAAFFALADNVRPFFGSLVSFFQAVK